MKLTEALQLAVDALDAATLPELKHAEKEARAITSDFAISANRRAIWRRLAVVLRASQK